MSRCQRRDNKTGKWKEIPSSSRKKKNPKNRPLISLLKRKTTAIAKHLARQTGGQCVGWTKKERRKCCKPGYNYFLALSCLQCFTYVWSSFPSLPLPAQPCTFIWTQDGECDNTILLTNTQPLQTAGTAPWGPGCPVLSYCDTNLYPYLLN